MRRKLFCLAIIVICILSTSCHHETLQERLHRESVEYTKKNCPQHIDQVTILDSICFSIEDNRYIYTYDIEGDGAAELVASQKDGFYTMLLDGVKNSTKLQVEKEADVSFLYIYYNKQTKKEIFRFLITPKDYK